jgi:hypothetical protein
VTGTNYTSPTYGYTLAWNSSWDVTEAWSEGGDDFLNLTNGIASITFEATKGFGGDPTTCLDDLIGAFRDDPATGELTLLEQGTGQLGESDATRAFAVYTGTAPLLDGTPAELTLSLECRTVVPGEAVLMIAHVAPAAAYREQTLGAKLFWRRCCFQPQSRKRVARLKDLWKTQTRKLSVPSMSRSTARGASISSMSCMLPTTSSSSLVSRRVATAREVRSRDCAWPFPIWRS